MSNTPTSITLNYAHICEMAFLSQNQNLNLIGIFEKVSAQNFPATFSRLSLVTSVKAPKGEHKMSIKILQDDSNQEIIKPIELTLTVKEPANDIRLIGDINNLQIKDPGKYRVEIHCDGQKIYQTYFSVEKAPQPIPQGR